jgi:heat shock protein HtpX
MTSALMRLQQVYQIPHNRRDDNKEGSDKLATMKISGKSKGFGSLFMTHPPLEERIAALRNKTYAASV